MWNGPLFWFDHHIVGVLSRYRLGVTFVVEVRESYVQILNITYVTVFNKEIHLLETPVL